MQPGGRIDEWVIDRVLGTGGTASVYACHLEADPAKSVAIKVLDEAALRQPEARKRMAREAKVLFDLEHPCLVAVHDVRVDADPPYLVMDLVEGDTLRTRMKEGPFTLAEALDICELLAEAVAYLHQRGIQHRDLKPDNVILRAGGGLCLVDFGLVLEEGASRLTAEGLRMGTVSYVPPEWSNPSLIDAVRWDVYALGVIFWELLVGRQAFPLFPTEEPMAGALRVVATKRGHPPLDPGAGIPLYLRSLIRDMTHVHPDQRPDNAHAVLFRMQSATPEEQRTAMETLDWPGLTPGGRPTLDELFYPEDLTDSERKALSVGDYAVPRWERIASAALIAFSTLGVLVLAGVAGWKLGQRINRPQVLVVAPVPVPVSVVEAVAEVARAAPTPKPALAPIPAPAPTPVPTAAPIATLAPVPALVVGRPVSAAAYRSWLGAHPDWKRDAAVASGRVDEAYLSGWTEDSPRGPATSVSWVAAAAFCESRGGLAPLHTAPERWDTTADQPYQEWRVNEGRPAWRTGDGRDRTGLDTRASSGLTGFRCAKP